MSSIKVRPYVLLSMSLLFYALGQLDFVLMLIGITVINIVILMILGNGKGLTRVIRLILLVAGIAINVGILMAFKYSDSLLLPLGLSFYVFKAVSLIVDCYKRTVEVESPIDVFNYLTFFGQVQSGPISRFDPKLKDELRKGLDISLFSNGVQRFLIGFSKKVLLANVLVKVTDEVFACEAPSMPYAWIGSICFSLQLYYDFSGYSDMAIGISNMFGMQCSENFQYPYATESIGDFWRRWHISLGQWFRDYVYIPLGGSKVKLSRTLLNLGIVWILILGNRLFCSNCI